MQSARVSCCRKVAGVVRRLGTFVRDKRSKQLNSEVSVVEHLDRLVTSVTSLENLLQLIDGSIFPIFYASLFDDNAGDQPWSRHPCQTNSYACTLKP